MPPPRRTTKPGRILPPKLVRNDPYLKPYTRQIAERLSLVREKVAAFTADGRDLKNMALGHLHYGLHRQEKFWMLREWAPGARAVYLVGECNNWKISNAFICKRAINGDWELRLPLDTLQHGQKYRLRVLWEGGEGDRIPAWAARVVQDPRSLVFDAQVWDPAPYVWKHDRPRVKNYTPLVYEAHVGMAGEEEKVSTYTEFTRRVLPRIQAAGYNTIQLMAVQEHPYYGSFGYHVSSFFAPSSRFGTPEELKELVDTAHSLGLVVVMDLVHSHAAKNEVEGLGRYDGTDYQFFHAGARGNHEGWDSKCFDYAKPEVVHFLLSNCRYWLEEFRFDGFRFDGVTSMLYYHHGMYRNFTNYEQYFNNEQDVDAIVYLHLANRVVHDVLPAAVTIAEEMSGMPGLALPQADGGYGFDFRLSMGTPDYWIKIIKERADEEWDMAEMFHELTNHRAGEGSIAYAESHDQAIVGDQTIIFRLMDKEMYEHMHVAHQSLVVDRGMALHKMIRLITLATAGDGYLNFMGNEFGHPEWIDFPRAGNGWSYKHARRQWGLADNPELRYGLLGTFDADMLACAAQHQVLRHPVVTAITVHNGDKVIAFARAGLVWVFNFHPAQSYTDYGLNVETGEYRIVLDTDQKKYGGHGRVDNSLAYVAQPAKRGQEKGLLKIYLPSRTALVFRKSG
jgi:1,4-alpha-glucan branching enzyme